MTFTKSFFTQDTITIAKSLLSHYLYHKTPEGITIGKIIETEAYLKDDPASHAYNGKTKRNAPMFNSPGRAYIYFIYGNHYCFNIVTNQKGIGEAVLIRALQPLKGIELMQQRRKILKKENLCNGPAKLVQAMGITKNYNNKNILKGNLKILKNKNKGKIKIKTTKRIGIKKGSSLPLRFYIIQNS